MTPSVARELGWAYGAVAAALLVGIGAWWWVSDDAAARQALTAAQADYARRVGPLDMQEQVKRSQAEISRLEADIEHLKSLSGLVPVPPFQVPDRDRGYYFKVVYDQVRDELRLMADQKGVRNFDASLGFALGEKPPPDDEAEYWLTMLQLVTKAAYLTLNTPTPLESVTFTPLRLNEVVLTGPARRPPLLEEYPLTVAVKGSLPDLQWLLHQVSLDERTEGSLDQRLTDWLGRISVKVRDAAQFNIDVQASRRSIGPLIVRGLEITSANVLPTQTITILDGDFRLAGMRFLDPQRRAEAGGSIRPTGRTGSNGGSTQARNDRTRPTTGGEPPRKVARP